MGEASAFEGLLIPFTAILGLGVIIAVFSTFFGKGKPKVALQGDAWVKFPLTRITKLSPNVCEYRFTLPKPNMALGLPIGQHVSLQGNDGEGEFMRPYTPTSSDKDLGYFDLVIKLYPQGRMSQFLSKAKEGDLLSFRGPKGRYQYQPNQYRALGMIAGGTGITPMYQVMRAVLDNPAEKTKMYLIFANVTADDILLKEDLEAMASANPERFSVYYVLNNPPADWQGGVGFITKDMISSHIPAPAEDVKVLRCGPPPMMKAMQAALEGLGFTKDMQFAF